MLKNETKKIEIIPQPKKFCKGENRSDFLLYPPFAERSPLLQKAPQLSRRRVVRFLGRGRIESEVAYATLDIKK